MSFQSTTFVGSPGSPNQEPSWKLHSSTDSYLSFSDRREDAQAPTPTGREHAGHISPEMNTDMARLTSDNSLKNAAAFSRHSPAGSSLNDNSSVLPHHGHAVSPDRPESPSYFAKLYFHGQSRSNTGSSPTITFTSAPVEPTLVSAAGMSPNQTTFSENSPTSAFAAEHNQDPLTGSRIPQTSSQSSHSNGHTPLSPTTSSRSTASGTSFFASLRPSSPGNTSVPTHRGTESEPSSISKPRRPSSVFEHVGNVFERFGRKVGHSRTATAAEQQTASSSYGRRSVSQHRRASTTNSNSEAVEETDGNTPSFPASMQSDVVSSVSGYVDPEATSSPTPTLDNLGAQEPFSAGASPPMPSTPAGRTNLASAPQVEELEELPYLAPAPDAQYTSARLADEAGRNTSTREGNESNIPSVAETSHARRSSMFERVLIQVTDDNERFSVVDISGVDSADAIKERMFAKLHLFDADFSNFQLFRTEIGQSEATGPVVNDDALLVLCLQMGDDRGTLKFLVHQTAPPSNSTVRAMPPPTSPLTSAKRLSDARGPSTAGSSTSHHLRTGSQSSRSSVSDALVHTEVFSSGDGGYEGSNRNSGSSLTRSKAQTRRALPSAPLMEELRSPTQAGGGGPSQPSQDRRSIASSNDSSHPDRSSRSEISGTGSGMGEPGSSVSHSQDSSLALGPAQQSGNGPNQRPNPAERSRAPPHGHRVERSDDGGRDQHRSNGSAPAGGLTLHNTKSMDDLRSQNSAGSSVSSTQAELQLHARLDRDGRYPAAEILRPSTTAPVASRDSVHGHRQYSSDAQPSHHRPDHSMQHQQQDPRMLQRNRSAQAALPGGAQPPPPQIPSRMASTPQIRSPPVSTTPNAHALIDPRLVRSGGFEDARYASTLGHPTQQVAGRPANLGARPQFSAPPTYSGPGPYAAQSLHQPSRAPMLPQGYPNEFGARGNLQNFNTYHGQDPRFAANSMPALSTPRPYSFHDQQQQQQRPPYVRPYPQPAVGPTSPYQSREDPFTTRFFPASSSRQVSEFQLKAGHLEPGMTVQETLRSKTPMGQPGYPYNTVQSHAPGPSYGPRDPRQPEPGSMAQQYGQTSRLQGQSHAGSTPMLQRQPQQYQQQPQQQQQQQQHHQQQQQQHRHHLPPGQLQHPQVGLSPRPHSYPSPQTLSQPPAPLRNPHERPHSTVHLPNPHYGPQGPATAPARVSQHSPASNGLEQELQRRDPVVRPNASERSSGSSFSSQGSSHVRPQSDEDQARRNSVEESFSAPTSARSSKSGSAGSKPHGREDRSSFTSARERRDGDLADEELAYIRPLPRPPGSSAAMPVESQSSAAVAGPAGKGALGRETEDEDTLRAGEWASLWKVLDPKTEGTVIGTTLSGSSAGDGDTLRAEPSTPGSAAKETSASSAAGSSVANFPRSSMPPEENGTFASFGNFDDDESESGTWAQPLDSDGNAARLPLRVSGINDLDELGTLQPGNGTLLASSSRDSPSAGSYSQRRPELRLTIDPEIGPTQIPAASLRSNPSPLPGSSNLSSLSSGGIIRSKSFAQRDNDWAFRPPPEQLYENLDDFFPKHDLDKPIVETATVPESPGMGGSPKSETSSVSLHNPTSAPAAAVPQVPHGRISKHKKSIRLVVQDRKKFLDRTEKRVPSQESDSSGGLLRRRSTKLWGTKVVEMTPGQEASAPATGPTSDSPSSDASQKPVFKWVKGDLIGKGTYGRVYLALNATTGEMIAVKQVELPRTASDREDSRQKGVVAALKSEIETLKDLDHPHIVSYLGFEETTTFLSIFLEYVPGGSVGSCLRKHGKFEEQTIKSFLHQILEGLAYLHSKGILHRDLKADNILVDFEGICKISDFGTVRRSDDIYGNVENMSLQGSIFWMAPEVVSLSKKGYSAKVDIWSLGCVVLEMFAGRRPWSEDEAVQAMFKIGAERKAPPIPADVKLSKQAAHFLRNCFEIDPAKRPTAQRLLDHVFTVPDEGWRFEQSALWRSLQR